jgi:hypothetical protein
MEEREQSRMTSVGALDIVVGMFGPAIQVTFDQNEALSSPGIRRDASLRLATSKVPSILKITSLIPRHVTMH